jgi:hypothetical protein
LPDSEAPISNRLVDLCQIGVVSVWQRRDLIRQRITGDPCSSWPRVCAASDTTAIWLPELIFVRRLAKRCARSGAFATHRAATELALFDLCQIGALLVWHRFWQRVVRSVVWVIDPAHVWEYTRALTAGFDP